jgi:methyltransferase (TIGR00027 family)
MTLDPVAQTSRLTAALRARESARPDRLFDDPFAARLAGPTGTRLLAEFGDNSTIAVRTRFFDDALTATGLSQIVIVAAGMDSRAYRLGFPAGTTVFELDRPEVLHLKEELIAPSATCRRVPVGVDLAGEWPAPLLDAGFDASRPTCWLAEGLMQYLTEPDVRRLIEHITALAAPGSQLLVDFVGQSLLDSPMMQPMLKQFAEHGMTWHYGTDRPEEVLAGWRTDVTLISTVGNELNRWPYPAVPRDTPGVGQGYFVRASR